MPSPPPSGRGPIERTQADAPYLRRHLRKVYATSPRIGVKIVKVLRLYGAGAFIVCLITL